MNDYWSNKTITSKVFLLSLCVLNILFLVYWILLSSNYCLHFDDAYFMWKLRDCSMFEYVKDMYMTRGGNFVGYGINAILFTLSNYIGAYRFWPIVFYLLGIFIVYVFAKDIKLNIHRIDMLIGVITLYNIYVLTSVDYAVFTWICAMGYYLYAPAICLFLKYVNASTLKWWQYIVLIVLALFISGNSVSISTVFFVILLFNGLYWWHSRAWNIHQTWEIPQVRRIVYLTIFMLVVFVIVIAAPGNYLRMESEFDIEQPSNLYEFVIACGECVSMFLYMMMFYLPYHALVLLFGYIVGTKSQYTFALFRCKTILVVLGSYLLYILISVIPLAYLSNGFEIQRNYTQISFFYLVCIFLVGYILGKGKIQNKLRVQLLSITCAIFMTVIVFLNIRQDIPVACKYRSAYEERETYLKHLQDIGNKETVYVTPLPSVATPDAKYNILKFFGKSTNMQAIYYFSDTGYEPNEYESHMRRLLQLDFDFILLPENEKAIE